MLETDNQIFEGGDRKELSREFQMLVEYKACLIWWFFNFDRIYGKSKPKIMVSAMQSFTTKYLLFTYFFNCC